MKPSRSRKDAVQPVGGGEALPPRPARVPITPSDQQAASDEWDRAMEDQGLPDLRGLLNAEVIE